MQETSKTFALLKLLEELQQNIFLLESFPLIMKKLQSFQYVFAFPQVYHHDYML